MAVASPDADAVIVPRRPIDKFDSTASGLLEIVPGEVDWIGFGQSTETGLCHESRQFDEQAESLFHDRGLPLWRPIREFAWPLSWVCGKSFSGRLTGLVLGRALRLVFVMCHANLTNRLKAYSTFQLALREVVFA
jgi:hypothetical protein